MAKTTQELVQEIRRLDEELSNTMTTSNAEELNALEEANRHSDIRGKLLSELEIAFKAENRHIFDIAIQADGFVRIDEVSTILRCLDDALSAVSDSLSIRSNISPSMAMLFTGSFGIRLVSQPDDKLLLGDIANGYSKFFDILAKVEDPDEDILQIFSGNRKSLRKFAKLYKGLSNEKKDVKFRWGSKNDVETEHTISPMKAVKAYNRLLMADTKEVTTERSSGVIKEINLLTRTFILLLDEQIGNMKQQTMKYIEKDREQITSRLDKQCNVSFTHERRFNPETEKIEEERIVVAIE